MSGGPVTEHLRALLAREVKRYGTLVWYDAHEHFAEFARSLELDDTTVVPFHGSYYRLRHEIEPVYAAYDRDTVATLPGLILYVPRAPLPAEVDVLRGPSRAGKVLDVSLHALAREALKERGPAAKLDDLLRDERLTLADLDHLGTTTTGDVSVVGLVFGTTSPTEIAARYLGDPAWRDLAREIDKRHGRQNLVAVFETALGLPPLSKMGHEALRNALARHVLLAAFRAGLPAQRIPATLAAFPQPSSPAQVSACIAVVEAMRDRQSMRTAYIAWAQDVQNEVRLGDLELPAEAADGLVFPRQDDLLLRRAIELASQGTDDNGVWSVMRDEAVSRATGFWAQAEPGRDVAWRTIAATLDLLSIAAQLRQDLAKVSSKATPGELVRRYAEGSPEFAHGAGSGGWYRLDALHREVEYLVTGLGEAFADGGMERLLHRARQVHRAAAEALNTRFIAAIEKVGFEFAPLNPQADTFDRHVRPSLDAGPVAYVLVDALRYEMGMELFASLSHAGRMRDAHAHPAISVVPTITPIGMAALLPGAEEGVSLVPASGDVAAVVKDHVLKNYADRKALWNDRFGSRLADLTLGEVLTVRADKLKKTVAGKTLILVRSQEIDEFGEQGNPYQARRTMSEVIGDVKKAVNLLANAGVSRFVVAADHGHLLFEELGDDQKIDPPGGETVSLHRRCWVGRGGTAAPGVLRVKAADMGMGGDLELAFPRGLDAFKAGGATTYFHGGLSPQELIVPVLTFTLEGVRPATEGSTGFSLGFPQGKITTRVFTVTARFDQYQRGLLDDPAAPVTRRVRCDAWDGKKSVARPLAALSGFEPATAEVALETGRDNSITLVIDDDIEGTGTLRLRLLDAETGAELKAVPKVAYDLSF